MKSVENGFKKPTLDEFCHYIEAHGFDIDPFALYKEFDDNDWKTQKGVQTKSWEALINARNGRVLQQKKKKDRMIKKREKRKLRLEEKEKTKEIRMHYDEYLHDSRWYSFRKFVFSVRGFECEICKSHECLQVHHVRYKNGLYPWEYSCKEVMVLCRKCHSRVHGTNE